MQKSSLPLFFIAATCIALSTQNANASVTSAVKVACKTVLTASIRTWDDLTDGLETYASNKESEALKAKLKSDDFKVLSEAKGRAFDIRILTDSTKMSPRLTESVMGHIQSFVETLSNAGFPVRNQIDLYLVSDAQNLGQETISSANASIFLSNKENIKRNKSDSRDASILVLPLNNRDGQLDLDFQTLQHEIGHQMLKDTLGRSNISKIGMYHEAFADSVAYLADNDPAQRVVTEKGKEIVIRDLYDGTTLRDTGTQKELSPMNLKQLKRRTDSHDASVLVSPLISAPVVELSSNAKVRSETFLEYWKNMARYRESFENRAKSIFGKDIDLNREEERLTVTANTTYAYAVYWLSYKDHPRALNFRTHLEKNCARIGLSFEEVEKLSQIIKPSGSFKDEMW